MCLFASSESEKSEVEIAAEGHLLEELLDVVEQRNNLVAMLEEDRLRWADLTHTGHTRSYTHDPHNNTFITYNNTFFTYTIINLLHMIIHLLHRIKHLLYTPTH